MRNTLHLLVFTLSFAFCSLNLHSQWVSIPDSNFGKWLNTNGYNQCLQGNSTTGWQMDTTCNAVVNAISIDCDSSSIIDLTGLEHFDALDSLSCQFVNAPSYYLNLPLLPQNLRYLNCANSVIGTLPPLPLSLEKLEVFRCGLVSMPSLPSSLIFLDCAVNYLTTLPSLPSNLTTLACWGNNLTYLPELPDSLYFFSCWANYFHCFPPLKKIVNFNFDTLWVSCLPNYPLSNLNSSPPLFSVPICDVFNGEGCLTITGKVYADEDANCLIGVNENGFANLKVHLLRNGMIVEERLTNGNGEYSFNTDSVGVYLYSVDTTSIPVACPDSGFYLSVASVAHTLNQNMNFGLRCKSGFDLKAQSITASVFRPANNIFVNITAGDASNFYNVHCAAGISGSVTLTYTGPVQFVSAAPNALTPTVSGNTLTWNIADFGNINFFTDFNMLMHTDTNAQIGQQVCFTLTVNPIAGDNNPANNTLTICFPVVNSYDPNDKTAYPTGDIDTHKNI